MRVVDLHLAVPAADEVRDQIHRPRPVQRHERRDVLDGAQLELPAQVAHAARFQLEHANRVAVVQQIVRFRVVGRHAIHIDIDVPPLLHHLAGAADDRQRFQPEKIHLQQAKILHRAHRVLGGDDTVLVFLER